MYIYICVYARFILTPFYLYHLTDDKLSLPSNESVTHIFSYAYEGKHK